MVCSNYDPDARENVCKNGIVHRLSSIVYGPESIVWVFNSTRPQGCVKRNNKVILMRLGQLATTC